MRSASATPRRAEIGEHPVSREANVDWSQYAQSYDLLLEHNPFYQELRDQVLSQVSRWSVEKGDRLADVGGGTGNYSVPVAERFPSATVVHADRDPAMNAIAAARPSGPASKTMVLTRSVDELEFEPESLGGYICIHALYTFPDPDAVLRAIHRWLVPGAPAMFVDPGRIVRVFDWQIALGYRMLRTYGLRRTLSVLRQGAEVSRQNREISKKQADGTYWTHTHEAFVQAVEAAGFVVEAAGTTFRGISDWVVVHKPASSAGSAAQP